VTGEGGEWERRGEEKETEGEGRGTVCLLLNGGLVTPLPLLPPGLRVLMFVGIFVPTAFVYRHDVCTTPLA